MDSLFDILGRKDFDEPAEGKIIKQFVRNTFDEAVAVTVREKEIIIAAPNASLAAALRLKTLELRRLLDTDKRLVFRIGK